MKRYLLLLLILVSCDIHSDYMTEPRPEYEWLWTENTIYFYFDDAKLPEETKEAIRAGADEISLKTNIEIIEVSKQSALEKLDNYVAIQGAPFSSGTTVGMQPGRNKMYFQYIDMEKVHIAIHEWGHELGLPHEQNMFYRDNDLLILWDNLYQSDNAFHQFELTDFSFNKTTIDFESIMLYPSDKYSQNGKPTMTKKDGTTWGLNTELSQGDINAINYLYP